MIMKARTFFEGMKGNAINITAKAKGLFTLEKRNTTDDIIRTIDEWFGKLEKAIIKYSKKVSVVFERWIITGILLLIVAKFIPEFPEQYPMIYQVGTAGLKIMEYLYKVMFGFFGDIASGDFHAFGNFLVNLWNGIVAVFEWMASIQF